jgi:hypothetical protein
MNAADQENVINVEDQECNECSKHGSTVSTHCDRRQMLEKYALLLYLHSLADEA